MNMNDNIRYCRYCGKQIDADSTFCTHCGKGQNINHNNDDTKDLRGYTIRIIMSLITFVKCLFKSVNPGIHHNTGSSKKWLKRIFMISLGAVCVGVVFLLYVFYTKSQMEKEVKRRTGELELIEKSKADSIANLINNAVENIVFKYQNSDDSIKILYACDIITIEKDWGYNKNLNEEIEKKLAYLRKDAFTFIEKNAFSGDPRCQFMLGQIYQCGDTNYYNASKDLAKAAYWWNEAASQGYTKAFNNIGIAYKLGQGVNVDLRKAVKFLKKGAEAGDNLAQQNYGDLFIDGVRIKIGSHKKRYTSSYSGDGWIKSYDDGDGYVYLYEKVVDDYETIIPKDIESARMWWKKAAAQGNEVAKERLQKVYN